MSSPLLRLYPDGVRGNVLRDRHEQLVATRDLIASEGRDIVINREAERVPDGAGGFVVTSTTPRAFPRQRMFFSLSQYEPLYGVNTSSGFGTHEKFVLIAMPGTDLKEGDWFYLPDLSNHKYIIGSIHADTMYQVKAEGEAIVDGSDPS